jgi:carboxyl-terminal processing protease
VIRPVIVMLVALAMLAAPEAGAQSPEIAPEQWKSLAKAVRIVKRDYVTVVDDERLAAGCADRVYTLPSLKARRPTQPVASLSDIPIALRSAADAAKDTLPAEIISACLGGMLGALDAHSRYVPPDEARQFTIGAASVGLELTVYNNTVFVVEVIEGGPAAAAGIKPGDRVAAIGGRSLDGLALHEVTRRLRGHVGSEVTVTIARGTDVLEFPMTRAVVKYVTMKAHVLDPGFVHLRLRQFNEGTLREIEAALAPLLEKVDTMPRALMLDLRDNSGGLLRTAIDLAAGLLPPNAVIGSTDGRNPVVKYRVTGDRRIWTREAVGEWLRTVPIAVLVNHGTASGAEIVAAALQAHGRALVLGTPTVGMGSIQTLIPLDDGGQMRLTTAVWLTPKGESFDGKPLTPDMLLVSSRGAVPGSDTKDVELQQAVEVFKTRRTPAR